MLRKWLLPLVLTIGAGFPTLLLSQAASAPEMWDLNDLYASTAAFDQAVTRMRATAEKLGSYQSTLGKSAESMLAALVAISDANREVTRINVYASLKSDDDVRVSANIERKQLAQSLATELGEKT